MTPVPVSYMIDVNGEKPDEVNENEKYRNR
jgi:hypothetical protein